MIGANLFLVCVLSLYVQSCQLLLLPTGTAFLFSVAFLKVCQMVSKMADLLVWTLG